MDDASFAEGMDLLKSLPSQQGIDPKKRFRDYAEAFAQDNGALFVAACKRGFATAWHFFPTPVEIREQMEAHLEQRRRVLERAHYAALVEDARQRVEAEDQRRLEDAEHLAPTPERAKWLGLRDRARGGEPVRLGDVLDLSAIRRQRVVRGSGGVA